MFQAKIRLSALMLTSLLALNSPAQKLWSLDECLDFAIENNLSLRQNRLTVKQAEINLQESQFSRYPNLNGSVNNSYNFGRSIDPLTNANVQRNSANLRFGLSSGVILFNGFQIHNSIQQRKNTLLATRFDEEVAKNDIGMTIANAFLQVLFAKELIVINEEQVSSTQLLLERAEKFYDAGRLAESAVLEMKAQLANDQLGFVNAKNQELMARVTLFQLLELSPDSNDILRPQIDSIPDAGVFSSGHLYSMYRSKAPELKAAQTRLEASNYGWKVAKGAYSPQLSLNANMGTLFSDQAVTPKYGQSLYYQQYYDINGNVVAQAPLPNVTGTETTPFVHQWNNNFGQTVSLSLSIPIFNNYSTKATVKRAEINYQNAFLTKEITDNSVQRDVAQAYNEYQAAKARYAASKSSFEAQEANINYAQKRRDENLISAIEFNVIRNNYINAKSNFLQAKYELIFRYKIIDFYKNGTVYPELH